LIWLARKTQFSGKLVHNAITWQAADLVERVAEGKVEGMEG
jgi:hypothetical protein